MTFQLNAISAADLAAEARAATRDAITAERVRRIEAGCLLTIDGLPDPVALQGRPEDMQTLHGLATAAQLRIGQGEGDRLTPFRDRDNADHLLTQAQVLDLWSKGAEWIEANYTASWALKDAVPIPEDWLADRHWPPADLVAS